MVLSKIVRSLGIVLVGAGMAALAAAPAGALQFSPTGNERINTFGSGLPGSPYSTGPGGVDYDQIGSSDPHPGILVGTGTIAQLNYHTTSNPGTNVSFNFAPALVFTLEAQLTKITFTPLFGTTVQATFEFSGTADSQPDLVVVDPSDNTTVLEADLTGGLLNGNPVAALTAQATFDAANPPTNVTGNFFAFFKVNPSSLYASLFENGIGSLDIAFSPGTVTNFDIGDSDPQFDFNDIVNAYLANPTLSGLISNVSEAQGSVFAISSSQFVVPEPGTAVLLAAGLLGLAAAGRRAGSGSR